MDLSPPTTGSPSRTAAALKEFARSLGFDAVGICRATVPPHLQAYRDWIARGHHAEMAYLREHLELKADPRLILPGASSIVAVALDYLPDPADRPDDPKIARYALGRDYHRVLRPRLRKIGEWLQARFPGSRFRVCVDSAPIMERDFANLAGLGWFGKNTCLIDSRRGSWFVIGLLLTTVDLPADDASVGGCGTCTKCIDACPTGAIVFEDGRWQIDARRCISYLTIEHKGPIPEPLAARTEGWVFGCDVCQEVCPFNQRRPSQPDRAPPTDEADFRPRRWPETARLAQIGREEWDRLTRGSAVRRAGWEGLRRNAAAAQNGSRSERGSEPKA
ncbi:MAG: tRNA epoxyqueuosine(34) reductase QueG [Fimbriimonadaceae bacterium]